MGTPRLVATTLNNTVTLTGLLPSVDYGYRVIASNSATTTSELKPVVMGGFRTSALVVKRGTKATAAVFAKAVNAKIPSGATLTIAKPAGPMAFTNCTIAKNVVTYKNFVGACSVQLTIKPKKVGRVQPRSTVLSYDVMIKK
jgi:hypothetical protein